MSIRHWAAGVIALAAAVVVVSPAAAAVPQNTAPPTISGTAREGQTLTAANGTWSNNPTSFAYQWQRCAADGSSCSAIAGATAKTYTLAAADVDHRVRVAVTASNADGQASATSRTTGLVSSSTAPVNTAKPQVTGVVQVGEELTATNGTWTGGVRTFAYRWERCPAGGTVCTPIVGATAKTYTIHSADTGSSLRVVVTATNLSGSSASAASDRTAVVDERTTTVTATTTTTAVNRAPTIALLRARLVGQRVYVRFRVCDDSGKALTVVERDTKRGLSSVRRFTTGSCGVFARHWLLKPYFRTGRFTVSLRAQDRSGKQSRVVRRTFR